MLHPKIWIPLLTLGIGLAAGLSAAALASRQDEAVQDQDRKQADAKLDVMLRELEEFGRRNRTMNVPHDHGRFLQLITQLTRARRVLEVGASNGYSSLWIARGLRETGGKLVTIEYDEKRGGWAKENFTKAGMDDIITLHLDDAFKVIPKLQGPFDLVFVDAWKEDYKKFFDLCLPLLEPGGLFLGHNAISHAEHMQDFLQAAKEHPRLITNVIQMGRDGFCISYKKRPTEL